MLGEAIDLLEKNVPKSKKKWANCKGQAKKKFDVYPSAYANAWAAKCYKKKGGKWKSIKENIAPYIDSMEIDNSEEDTKELNRTAFKDIKQEKPDLPSIKALKNKKPMNETRLEYFRELLNIAKEINEEI
jgi:hypothetical protein